MAKIVEERIVIKISRLVKEGDDKPVTVIQGDLVLALEQVAQVLAGTEVIVEVEAIE